MIKKLLKSIAKFFSRRRGYLLHIVTDWDFGVQYQGNTYCDYEFTLWLKSVEDLPEVKIVTCFGGPAKCYEFEAGIQAIQADPESYFSNEGGNRGVTWTPLSTCI